MPKFVCQHCGASYDLAQEFAGRKARCGQCNEKSVVKFAPVVVRFVPPAEQLPAIVDRVVLIPRKRMRGEKYVIACTAVFAIAVLVAVFFVQTSSDSPK